MGRGVILPVSVGPEYGVGVTGDSAASVQTYLAKKRVDLFPNDFTGGCNFEDPSGGSFAQQGVAIG